jgi:hypothetical protein
VSVLLSIISNPIFLFFAGVLISFAGSVVANYLFFGKVEKSRAMRESKRAYNKLVSRLLHTTITEINDPLHILPVEIADRMEDLKFAIADFNPKFDYLIQVRAAIKQAAEQRKQQLEKYPQTPTRSNPA